MNKDKAGYRPIINEQCSCTKECKNNKCFFKLRDCYGYPVFYYDGIKEDIINAVEKAGIDREDVMFPELKASIGTNVIYVLCEDMVE